MDNRFRWTRRTRTLFASALVLVSIVGVRVYLTLLRNEPLDKVADQIQHAFESGNDRFIFDRLIEFERRDPNLNKESFSALNNWLRGKISQHQPPKSTGEFGNGGESYSRTLEYVRDDGNSMQMWFYLVRTDEGPRLWWVRFAVDAGLLAGIKGPVPKNTFKALATEMQRELPVLENLGISGARNSQPNAPFETWKELIEKSNSFANIFEEDYKASLSK